MAPFFRLVRSVQPWGMVEVFLLGMLVSLVNLSHMASVLPGPAFWAMAALILTVTLAGETLRQGITVNCVSPGGIDSEADGDPEGRALAVRDPSWNPPEAMAELARLSRSRPNSMGRISHPTEVAAAVAFFASPEASYVTGQHVGVSGGMAMI